MPYLCSALFGDGGTTRRAGLPQSTNETVMTRLRNTLALLLLFALCPTAWAQLPAVRLKDTGGREVQTDTLANGGRPFLISFFATWCKPCLSELAAIHDVYPDWQAETGVRLIAVSIDEAQNAQRVKPLADAAGWDYEVLLDTNSEFRRAMGVQGIPHIFVVDGKGRVALSRSGYAEGSEEEVIEKVRELINRP